MTRDAERIFADYWDATRPRLIILKEKAMQTEDKTTEHIEVSQSDLEEYMFQTGALVMQESRARSLLETIAEHQKEYASLIRDIEDAHKHINELQVKLMPPGTEWGPANRKESEE